MAGGDAGISSSLFSRLLRDGLASGVGNRSARTVSLTDQSSQLQMGESFMAGGGGVVDLSAWSDMLERVLERQAEFKGLSEQMRLD